MEERMGLPFRAAPAKEPRRIRTANGGLRAISLLTKERVQRFSRQQCDRAHASFVDYVKAFGKVVGEYLSERDKTVLADGHASIGRSSQEAYRAIAERPSIDNASRRLESHLAGALGAAESAARGAWRLGDAAKLQELRRQMIVLSYSTASLDASHGGATRSLYAHALRTLDRIDDIAGVRRNRADGSGASIHAGH